MLVVLWGRPGLGRACGRDKECRIEKPKEEAGRHASDAVVSRFLVFAPRGPTRATRFGRTLHSKSLVVVAWEYVAWTGRGPSVASAAGGSPLLLLVRRKRTGNAHRKRTGNAPESHRKLGDDAALPHWQMRCKSSLCRWTPAQRKNGPARESSSPLACTQRGGMAPSPLPWLRWLAGLPVAPPRGRFNPRLSLNIDVLQTLLSGAVGPRGPRLALPPRPRLLCWPGAHQGPGGPDGAGACGRGLCFVGCLGQALGWGYLPRMTDGWAASRVCLVSRSLPSWTP